MIASDTVMPRKKMRKAPGPPPGVINGFRVLYYAHIRPPITYSGHTYIYIGGREVGRVPRAAITEGLRGEGFGLMLCDRYWHAVTNGGGYKSVSEAKQRAERMYPGINRAWVKLSVSKREAKRIEREHWRGQECSFCGRIPRDFQQCLHSGRARICNICVAENFWDFSLSEQLHSGAVRGDYYPQDGFEHIQTYIARLLSSKRKNAYMLIFAPDATRGFALFRRAGRIVSEKRP